jgi:two-component system, chemotaxis family, chemotaxis protein CheY
MASILIVDDDPNVLRALARILTTQGHDVTEAADGVQAVARAADGPPDLAIVDMYMPGQDGIQTIQQLRRNQPELPIVAMSGGGTDVNVDVLEVATVLGAAVTLRKPFELEEVREAVDAAFQSRG